MVETRTASITLAHDGILIVRIRKGAQQLPGDARENLAAALSARADRRRPLLVDITGSKPLDTETRHLYSGELLVEGFTALGLLVAASPLGRMMGNVYFRVARPGIPVHLFTDEPSALAWLHRYVE
jgi:hypothetical protein